jgi:hypothetical protein
MDFNNITLEALSVLPDGAIKVEEINNRTFTYRASVNDNRFPAYHRSNAVTMIDVWNPGLDEYTSILFVPNGMLWLTDMFNKAYFKHFFNNTEIITGIQMMPTEIDNGDNVQRLINLCGNIFYPMAVSLLMPLFMYTIVLEKEAKLVEIMKINGMKMRYYWLSNFVFNFLLYGFTMLIFNLIGGFGFNLSLFTDTDPWLLIIIFTGWGLCQVGMAFFFQSFITNARSSTSKLYYNRKLSGI